MEEQTSANLSGLPIFPASATGSGLYGASTTRSGRRIASTPATNGYTRDTISSAYTQRLNGLRAGTGAGPRDSFVTNSSTSTSGILGADSSLLERSSSPSVLDGVDQTNAAGEQHELGSCSGEDEEDDSDNDDDLSWTLLDRMRVWRNDALTQHLYSTAIFWGSKVFTRTRDPNDGFWLAQAHFASGGFSKAERVLTGIWEVHEQSLDGDGPALDTRARDKGKARAVDVNETDMNLDDDGQYGEQAEGEDAPLRSSTTERGGVRRNQQPHQPGCNSIQENDVDTPTLGGGGELPRTEKGGAAAAPTVSSSQVSTVQAGGGRMRTVPGTEGTGASAGGLAERRGARAPARLIRLSDISLACRYLAGQALVRQEKWGAAMDLLGEMHPFRPKSRSAKSRSDAADAAAGDGGIKVRADELRMSQVRTGR